jgi:hypothetical protein
MFKIKYEGDAPVVVLGGTEDPATPIRWAQEMVTEMGTNATLLTFNGEGHSQIFNSRCVDDIAKELFNFGRKPSVDVECDADVPVAKPDWWDDVVTLDSVKPNKDMMNSYFAIEPVDAYTEYFEIQGSADDVFAKVKTAIEANGWVYEEGDSADPVIDTQWFYDSTDESRNVGVVLAPPNELKDDNMVVPDGIVQSGSSVVMVYFWP